MIVYFADRSMDILGLASTGLPEGFLLTNDNKTEDIDSGIAVFEAEINYTDDTHVKAKALTAVGNFLLRQNGDLYEAYTIIEREDNNLAGSIYVYAEDAGLDLLNSIAEAYTATEAHPIAWYVDKWAASSGFAVGINEIPNLTRTLSWDADATATERIRSVANQFDNAEIGYSFSVRNFRITGKFIDIYKHRGKDIAQELRMGREVGSIVEKSSIAELATALKVTGGTPAPTDADPSPQPITLEGYSYDDGDFYTDGQFLRSREALKTWGRYRTDGIIAVNSNITKTYTYDTTSQSELCSRSITQLTKLREPEVNYEVSLLYLPDNLVVGDTVRIVDDKGELYLSARLLKLEVSISNETRVATFGDFLIKSSGVSARIDALADEFSRIQQARTLYTWKVYADDASGTGISTDSTGKAYIGLATNKLSQTPDLTDPTLYTWSKIEGDPGATGPAGPTGPTGPQGESATIVSQSVSYCLSDSGTEAGGTTRITENSVIRVLENGEVRELEAAVAPWQSTVPAYEPNTYLWTKTTIVYSDGTVIDSYSVSYNQPKVDSVVSEYYLSTSKTTQNGGSWSETPAEYINGRYYWKRGKTTWNDGTIEYSDPVLEQNMTSAHEEASEAKKIATNYMSSDNTGIMVADLEDGEQTPSTATGRNVRITNTAVEVRDGQDVKASFGTEVVLGDTNESKLRLGDKYIRAQDSDDNAYYEVQDLRGETITARFLGTEVRRYNNACPLYYASEIVSVTVGGTATTAYTLESDGSILYLTNDPQDNDIVITYKTSSTAPAFTFGTRGNEAQGIFSATFGQDNIASALHSFASGHATEATQECASAEGAYSKASGYASHAQNYGTVAPNAYETAIGKYNKAVDSPTDGSSILFYIGNGTDGTDRHNALTVDENGNIETNEVQSILSKLSNDLSGVDLNDITEPGNYSVAASTAITNTPFNTNPAGATSPAFSLMVFNSRIVTSTTSETVVLQVAWSKDAGAVRARIYQSLTWSAWQTLMSTTQPTFSRDTTNTSTMTVNMERVGDMVVGTFRATTKIQFASGTAYRLGTVNPIPSTNAVFFTRSGNVFDIQGWISSANGNVSVQSGTALAANRSIEGMFIYHPTH